MRDLLKTKTNAPHDKTYPLPIKLFTYGTLKRGGWNHQRFCRDAVSIEERFVIGRLYRLPSDIPILDIPTQSIFAIGTNDPTLDAQTLSSIAVLPTVHNLSEWLCIQGEMMTFIDPNTSIPPIDRLKGFNPNGPSLYVRVLIPTITAKGDTEAAWCYIAPDYILRSAIPLEKICWAP